MSGWGKEKGILIEAQQWMTHHGKLHQGLVHLISNKMIDTTKMPARYAVWLLEMLAWNPSKPTPQFPPEPNTIRKEKSDASV